MLAAVLSGERAEDKAIEEDAKKGIFRARKPVQGNSRRRRRRHRGRRRRTARAATAMDVVRERRTVVCRP